MRMPDNPKPSVLHVYKDYWPPVVGGMEKCIHWICDRTRREFHVRVLVASRSRRLVDEIVDGVRVVRVPCYARKLSSPLAPGFIPWLKRLDSDILHFHMPNPVGEIAYLIARPPRGRVVVTYQSDIVRQRLTGALYSPLQQAFLRRADVVMASSQRYLDTSPALAHHRDRCRVVPLGIPIEEMQPTQEARQYADEIAHRVPARLRIVFLGVLRYYKGLHILLEAMTALEPDIALVIGGDGPERRRLEEQVRRDGLADRVRFLGRLDDTQALGLLLAGDIFCMPSHLRAEAFGLAQVEAMACALPVVSCDLPTGVPEVNRHQESGLVVPPGDAQALRRAIQNLADDPDLRRRLAQGAKQRARAHYSARRMADDVAQVYRQVLGLAPALQ